MTDASPRYYPPWRERDLAALHFHWDSMPPADLAAMLGRTPIGIYQAARREGLGLGRPRGALSVTEAARQAGMQFEAFKQACLAAGVKLRPNRASRINPCVRDKSQRRERWVTPEDMHRAVAWFCASETITAAAARLGVSRYALDRVLEQRGARVCPIGRSLRVLPGEADAAAQAWLAEGGQRRGPKPAPARL